MRVKWFKVIAALIVVGAVLALIFSQMKGKINNSRTLRVPLFLRQLSESLHPERIDSIEQYTFINALFSPLVLFDNSGRIEANIATEFYWDDDRTLVFHFDRPQKTIDGYDIGAQDALVSLKRMILLNNNMHGNLLDRIDVPTTFKKLSDEIPDLFVRDNKLFMRLKKRDFAIMHILASADHVIIPSKSIDESTLKIIDFRNTSGPFYLQSEDEKKAILRQNPGHFRLSETNPSEIHCLKFWKSPSSVVELFKRGEIDHIPTASPIGSKNYVKLSEDEGTQLHQTRDIMLFMGIFTERARKKFSAAERAVLSEAFSKGFRDSITSTVPLAQPTIQFFHKDGVGYIQNDEFLGKRSSVLNSPAARRVDPKTYVLKIETSEAFAGLIRKFAESEFKQLEFKTIYDTLGRVANSEADVIFTGIDVGLKEDFTGLSFAFEFGIFPFSQREGRDWLKNLSYIDDSGKRAGLIQTLHERSLLLDPTIIPLYRLPSFAVARNGWTMDLPKLWVTERFWQLHKK